VVLPGSGAAALRAVLSLARCCQRCDGAIWCPRSAGGVAIGAAAPQVVLQLVALLELSPPVVLQLVASPELSPPVVSFLESAPELFPPVVL
jgi:hypothetical protein